MRLLRRPLLTSERPSITVKVTVSQGHNVVIVFWLRKWFYENIDVASIMTCMWSLEKNGVDKRFLERRHISIFATLMCLMCNIVYF